MHEYYRSRRWRWEAFIHYFALSVIQEAGADAKSEAGPKWGKYNLQAKNSHASGADTFGRLPPPPTLRVRVSVSVSRSEPLSAAALVSPSIY